MTDTCVRFTLREWETLRPQPGNGLTSLKLDKKDDRLMAESLAKAGLIDIVELRTGLMIRSFSYVGRIRLGNIDISVLPKLKQSSLLNLLRYAYGFRNLKLFSPSAQWVEYGGFADFLVAQLVAEIHELVARGLHRTYLPRHDLLFSPRGRVDIRRLIAQGGVVTAGLPCIHYPRIEDTLLNKILLAGLESARIVASDLQLRREASRLVAMFEEQVSPAKLNRAVLDRGNHTQNRLTRAYQPALTIIRLLYESRGVVIDHDDVSLQLRGFLFDMNRFFQSLLSRFLRDNLPDYAIRDELRLRRMIQFVPGFNPRNQRDPTLRPDFVILHGTQQVAILDAKYRDLWERELPREMLYQLTIYAASNGKRSAAILYPTTAIAAREARISITDSLLGKQTALVCLRPVDMVRLESLLGSKNTAAVLRERRAFAEELAFGTRPSLSA